MQKFNTVDVIIFTIIIVSGFFWIRNNIGSGGTLEKSREGATKGNLSAIRSAICVYYDEHKGVWPDDLTTDFTSYLYPIPRAKATPLGNSPDVAIVKGPPMKEGKGWVYCPQTGEVWANSIERDTRGEPFSSY